MAIVVIDSKEMAVVEFTSSDHTIEKIVSIENVVMNASECCFVFHIFKIMGSYRNFLA
jgi:hypothetical protein